MNYKHAFHTGNFADVLKHSLLMWIAQALGQKEKAICYIDTHAGAPYYDLQSSACQMTQEYRDGVVRLLAQPEPPASLLPYIQTIYAFNQSLGHTGSEIRYYPGSCAFIQAALRGQDKLFATELEPNVFQELSSYFKANKQVHCQQQDGYGALKALVPPVARRGLVLCDPPFELRTEFDDLARHILEAWQKWPTGVYLVWFPIKVSSVVQQFLARFQDVPKVRLFELDNGLHGGDRLRACACLTINLPWALEANLSEYIHFLTNALVQSPEGYVRSHTLDG